MSDLHAEGPVVKNLVFWCVFTTHTAETIDAVTTRMAQAGSLPAHTAACGSTTAIASRPESALAAFPAVHASSKSITGASTASEVQAVLVEEFKLSSSVAQQLATDFRNSGAGVTAGAQLMKPLRTFGPTAFLVIWTGIRYKNAQALNPQRDPAQVITSKAYL